MKTPASDRRMFLKTSAGIAGGVALLPVGSLAAPAKLRITGIELLPVRATERTVWMFVRLRTDAGLFGLGEASDAFGFANTTAENARTMESELRTFFRLIEGKSPLEIEGYLKPVEIFQDGSIRVPEKPGFGIELNDSVIRSRLL